MHSAKQALIQLNALLVKHNLPQVKRYAEVSPLLLVALFECIQGERLAIEHRTQTSTIEQARQIHLLLAEISKTLIKLDISLLNVQAIVARDEVNLRKVIHILLIANQVFSLSRDLSCMTEDNNDELTLTSEWVSDVEEDEKKPAPESSKHNRRKCSLQNSNAAPIRCRSDPVNLTPRANVDLGDLYHMLKAHCSPTSKAATLTRPSPVATIKTPDYLSYRDSPKRRSMLRPVPSPRYSVSTARCHQQPSPRFNRFKRSLGSSSNRYAKSESFTIPSNFQSLRASIRSMAGNSDAVFYQDASFM
jgi:hypothetical protein